MLIGGKLGINIIFDVQLFHHELEYSFEVGLSVK